MAACASSEYMLATTGGFDFMDTKDPLEQKLEHVLRAHGIRFSRPERDPKTYNTLDYYLPDRDLFIEVKAYSTARLHDQLTRSQVDAGPVMVLIGMGAVMAFEELLSGAQHPDPTKLGTNPSLSQFGSL